MTVFQTTDPQMPRTKEKLREERLVLDRELQALYHLRNDKIATWGKYSWDGAIDKLIAHFQFKIEAIDLELARFESN